MFQLELDYFSNVRLRLLLYGALLVTALADGQSGDSGPRVSITPRVRPVAASLARSTFRLDVNLIQVPVTVTDMRDHPVMGLRKTSFRIFEDDVEQQIAAFSMADGPVSAGIVFDASGSMRNRIDESRAAVEQFFRTSVPGDEFSLVCFSDRADVVTRWTRDSGEISQELTRVRPKGWTAMIDGIRLSLGEMRRSSNPRRILLVLSDGGDNNSRYSETELLSILREVDVRLWAVGLFERPRYLKKLADETGGRVVWIHKLAELRDAMERLSLQIRNEYVIGYSSNHAQNDGRYHKLRIEVQPPPEMKQVRATWRQGYIAP
jgi:Ca-activated chloride channel homolog